MWFALHEIWIVNNTCLFEQKKKITHSFFGFLSLTVIVYSIIDAFQHKNAFEMYDRKPNVFV